MKVLCNASTKSNSLAQKDFGGALVKFSEVLLKEEKEEVTLVGVVFSAEMRKPEKAGNFSNPGGHPVHHVPSTMRGDGLMP